tara:strand:+ start:407 stop:949 length:543 start_codon:yes stop_codon:yes gene_type:complete
MAYKQKWGMSRSKSPLNNTEKPKSIMDPNYVDEDPSRNDIIQQNNKLADQNSMNVFTPGIDLKGQAKKKVLTQIAKSGALGQTIKGVGKLAARANPIATFFEVFLGSQSAYAPNLNQQQLEQEFQENYKKETEAKRKDDIKGMSKSEIAEYDKNKEMEKQMEKIKNMQQGSGPKHMLSQG